MFLKNLKYNFILLSIIMLFSCNNSETNFNGHWHLKDKDGLPYHYSIVDILDSIAIIDKAKFENYTYDVEFNSKTNQIKLKNPLNIEYNFTIQGNTLLLLDDNSEIIAKGIKHDTSNCSFESHFFADRLVSIKLPKIEAEPLPENNSISYANIYFLGKPKSQKKHRSVAKLQALSRFISIKEMELKTAELEAKIVERHRHKMFSIFFVDKSTNTDFLIETIDQQRSISDHSIYIAGKPKQKINISDELVFIKIDQSEKIKPSTTIEEWLKLR